MPSSAASSVPAHITPEAMRRSAARSGPHAERHQCHESGEEEHAHEGARSTGPGDGELAAHQRDQPRSTATIGAASGKARCVAATTMAPVARWSSTIRATSEVPA